MSHDKNINNTQWIQKLEHTMTDDRDIWITSPYISSGIRYSLLFGCPKVILTMYVSYLSCELLEHATGLRKLSTLYIKFCAGTYLSVCVCVCMDICVYMLNGKK